MTSETRLKTIPLMSHSLVFFSDVWLSVYYHSINGKGCYFQSLKYNRKDLVFTLHYFHCVKKGFLSLYYPKKIKKKYPFRLKLTLILCLIEQYIYLLLVL